MIESNKKINGVDFPGVPFRTSEKITWCPGCPDFMILESTRRALMSLTKKDFKEKDFAMVTGIGCHGKIFDYLKLSGVYGLHGRALPTAMGVKLGNPNLKVLVFAGDGDTYSEGVEHFIHACRLNPDITLLVHDNQSFSLTTGQATPTSQYGFKTKAEPLGKSSNPLNPIQLALSAGVTFIARCNAFDLDHTKETIEKAVRHNGFSFVEIIQDCMVFNLAVNSKDSLMYKLEDKKRTFGESMQLAREFDYNLGKGKIPLGIIYEEEKVSLEDSWPQLKELKARKIGWSDFKR